MRSSGILHLLISSDVVIGHCYLSVCQLALFSLCMRGSQDQFCFSSSISEIYKTRRLKKDLHILHMLACKDLPAVSVNDRAQVPPHAWSLVGEAWIQHMLPQRCYGWKLSANCTHSRGEFSDILSCQHSLLYWSNMSLFIGA